MMLYQKLDIKEICNADTMCPLRCGTELDAN